MTLEEKLDLIVALVEAMKGQRVYAVSFAIYTGDAQDCDEHLTAELRISDRNYDLLASHRGANRTDATNQLLAALFEDAKRMVTSIERVLSDRGLL